MPQEYYVFARNRDEHGGFMDGCMVWWRPDGHGYTYDLNFAGIFTDEDRAKRYPPDDTCVYVPREIVDEQCSYSPRLAWWSRSRGPSGSMALFDALRDSAVSAPESTLSTVL